MATLLREALGHLCNTRCDKLDCVLNQEMDKISQSNGCSLGEPVTLLILQWSLPREIRNVKNMTQVFIVKDENNGNPFEFHVFWEEILVTEIDLVPVTQGKFLLGRLLAALGFILFVCFLFLFTSPSLNPSLWGLTRGYSWKRGYGTN